MATFRVASLAAGRVWLDLAVDVIDDGYRVTGAAWANDTDDVAWVEIVTSDQHERERIAYEGIPPRTSGSRNVRGNPTRRTNPGISMSWERGR